MNFFEMLEDQIDGGFDGLPEDPELGTLNLVLTIEKEKTDGRKVEVFAHGALTNAETFFALAKLAEGLNVDLSNPRQVKLLTVFAANLKGRGI